MKKETKNKEVTNNFIFIYEKGDEKMKGKLLEYVKLGFGFYIGFNAARVLKHLIIKTTNK